MNVRILLLLAIFFLIINTAGCSTQVPTIEKKQITHNKIIINDAEINYGWPSIDWWKKYKNNELNEIVEFAINNSPTIEVARSRFLTAVANIQQINPSNKLDINLLANFNGNYASKNGSTPPPLSAKWIKNYSVGLSLSYQLDIWGVNKGLLSAASYIAKAQAANVENAKLLIASTVVQNYFILQLNFVNLNLAHQQLDIQYQILANYKKSLDLGIANIDPIIKTEHNINNLQAQIAIIKNAINIQKHILIALVGGKESFINSLSIKPLPSVKIEAPQNLNYELLSRRADLQAQKWLVESSLGLVASSKAAFYPTFTLTGFGGFNSINLNNLLSLPSKQFSITPTLYLPIFNTGMLKAQLLSSKAKHNESIANYNSAIVNAIKDVNVAVSNLNLINNQIYYAKNNFNLAKQSLNNNTKKFNLGLLPEITVLTSRLDTINKQIDLASLVYQRLINDVNLIKALGGGYKYN